MSCGESLNSFQKKQKPVKPSSLKDAENDYYDEDENDEDYDPNFIEPRMPSNPLGILKRTTKLDKNSIVFDYGRKTFDGRELQKIHESRARQSNQ